MKKPFAQIPFNPARWPFFYGWLILFWGIIGILLSVPGQTTGVSAFIEPLIKDLGLGRFELSLAYMVGTFSSSFLLTPAGKLFDRIGARWMGFGSCFALGIVLLLLSQVDHMAQLLAKLLPEHYAMTGMLAFLFLLLRLSGQGVLTMSSRNMVMKWFDHHRGLASGISGAAIAFGFSYAPTLFSNMIGTHGWSGTWLMMSLALLLLFAPLLLIFFRDTHENFGLVHDGRKHDASKQNEPVRRQFTLSEARASFAFWPFTLTIALQALVITAVTFHVESVVELAGMEGSRGFEIFPPLAWVSVAVTLLGGWLSDKTQLRWFLMIMLAGLVTNIWGMMNLKEGWPIYCIIIGGGVSNGMFGILMSVTWPRYYGREHIGAISGLSMTFMVIASSLGPALFSGILKWQGTYSAGYTVCLISALILLISAPFARNPQLKN